MEKWNIPIYKGIKKYLDTGPVPYHMPGHKLGKGVPGFFARELARLDITEIPDADNLHHPTGIIKEAQELAAQAFGSIETFFLVNGSTAGIQAMIASVCKPGGKLIIARDCHKSVISGLMLAGVRPVYIKPEYDEFFGISTVINPEELNKTLAEHPDAQGVLITRPNYYGICSDIKAIADIVHSHGKTLAVDEAHGAHLGFCTRLPASAMQAGADICVQSAHKTLPAFTQGAYLHVGSGRIDRGRLKFMLDLLQTSSPSYIIMAGLDIARDIMQRRGEEALSELINKIGQFKSNLGEVPGMTYLEGSPGYGWETDATRLVFNFRKACRTGYDVESELRARFALQVEMSDLYNIVCIATIFDGDEALDRLAAALKETAADIPAPGAAVPGAATPGAAAPGIPPAVLDPHEIPGCSRESIPLRSAAGRVCAGMPVPYPPGIPVICPGELITADAIEYICSIIKAGGTVNGLGENCTIDVVADSEVKAFKRKLR